MVWWTTYALNQGEFALHPYDYFIFWSTLSLYNLHRYIGFNKINSKLDIQDRFGYIQHRRNWLLLFVSVTSSISLYYFLLMIGQINVVLLIVPVLISGLYAIPIFSRRLRDVAYVKIILIAIIWSWLTALNPAVLLGHKDSMVVLLIIERFLFVLAITIPFDIRDIRHDKGSQLKTIVSQWGVKRSKWIAIACLLLAIICAYYLFSIGIYSSVVFSAILVTYLLAGILIKYSLPSRHEFYFVGLLDGTMALPFLLTLLFSLCV